MRHELQCSKKVDILKSDETGREKKVLRMGRPGGQIVSWPCESILALSRGSQLPYTSKENDRSLIFFINIRYFPIRCGLALKGWLP